MNEADYPRTKTIHLPRPPLDVAKDVLAQAHLGTLDDYDIPQHQGIYSIVLFPKRDPAAALKIPLGSRPPEFFAREIENLQRAASLGIESVDIVRIITYGRQPDYVLMSRLGPTLTDLWEQSHPPAQAEIDRLGRIVADFVVEFHRKSGGLIHRDLHYENLTRQPNERYGVLDFGDCGADDIEAGFVQLAIRDHNIIPAIARRVLKLTDTPLDLDKLRHAAEAWIAQEEASSLGL